MHPVSPFLGVSPRASNDSLSSLLHSFPIRSRLKGCEAEVAALLDEQWKGTTVDWIHLEDLDERRIGA